MLVAAHQLRLLGEAWRLPYFVVCPLQCVTLTESLDPCAAATIGLAIGGNVVIL